MDRLTYKGQHVVTQLAKRTPGHERRERQLKLSDSERRDETNAKPKAQQPHKKIFSYVWHDLWPISRRNLRTRTGLGSASKLLHRRARAHGGHGKAAPRRTGSGG